MQTHYIETRQGKIQIRRKCDGGLSFEFKNTTEGQILAGRKMRRLERNDPIIAMNMITARETTDYVRQSLLNDYPQFQPLANALDDPIGTIIRKFKTQMSGVA